MKNKTLILIGVLIFLSAVVATGYWYFYQAKVPVVTQTENNQLVGGDRDAHGCIGSAGYSWCEAKDKCLRSWEEACETVKNSQNLPQGYTLDNYTITETLTTSCTQDSECATPAKYLVQSSCPYTSLCLNNNCTVVCPGQIAAQEETNLEYKNAQSGFNFILPLTWKDYSIVNETWTGNLVSGPAETFNGPKILIRHPLWTAKNIRQDIPIMIFTLDQWKLIESDTLSVGAAPIAPSELGRNDRYVFALPARYNFAFPEGFEEVQKIIDSKPLSAL